MYGLVKIWIAFFDGINKCTYLKVLATQAQNSDTPHVWMIGIRSEQVFQNSRVLPCSTTSTLVVEEFDAIKSAGACKKGGTAPVVDVLDYTEPATKPGLSLVCTPGNDVEATTGKAASGATLILFTTGLGTPTGNPVCPTIKVATNSTLAKRMADIIDIDCGPIVEGEKTIEEMGEEIMEYCIKAASGEVIPKAVQLNQDDFIPWKRGVSL